jgi:uncharacterized protein (TIGR02270 family)
MAVMDPEVRDARPADAIAADVVQLHAEDAALLYGARRHHLRAPDVTLARLARADERLAAHLDGLDAAGESAWPFCEAALARGSAGPMFTAAVRVLESRQPQRLIRLLSLAEAIDECRSGLASALGWVERSRLHGVVAELLQSPAPFRRLMGITACALQRVDPGPSIERLVVDPDERVRARARRTVGELGLVRLLQRPISGDGGDSRFWSAWSSVLLGERGAAVRELTRTAVAPGPHRARAFALSLQASSPGDAHALLQQLAGDPAQLGWLIQGSGIAGDPAYVPWLLQHMARSRTARRAGEAFSLITGANLDDLTLWRPRPDDVDTEPTDDPDDPNVEMDPDEGLPWPDPEKIERWWAAGRARFTPGRRYFVGAPVTTEHCIDVLETGCQRQRILAAHYLSLLDPGTALFNTSAPAWRQQRRLATMA